MTRARLYVPAALRNLLRNVVVQPSAHGRCLHAHHIGAGRVNRCSPHAGHQATQGKFWPIWPIAGWGVGVLMHGYSVFWAGRCTEEEIEREMKSLP